MPDLPISGLPSASALAGTEPVPIVQGGVTVKTTTADIAALASGVSDGDKGDITVSSSGTVWTIDPTVVSNSKLANVATATFKGRTTAGTGAPEDLTVAQAKTLLNLAGTNTGDQTITLTGDVTGSGTGSFAATIANDTVTNAKSANMATATIKGRTTAGTGDPEDLTATQVKTLLAIAAGDVSGLAAIATSGSASDLSGTKPSTFITDFTEAAQDSVGVMVDSTIVYNDATPSLGRAAITGDVTISAGSNAATIPAGTVTLAQQANLAANSIVGNNTGVAATPIALTATQTTAMLNVFTDLAKGLVPASGGGTSNFLRADGTFAAPPTGGVTDGDKGDITVSSSGTVWTIDNDAVTYGQIQNVTGNSFLGRAASGAGDVGEISVGASELVGRGSTGNITSITLGTNLSMSGTTLNATGGGVTDGDKGDITVSSSGTVWTIDAGVVSNAKLADVATATFKGRTTAGTGSPEDLTATQATAILDTFTSSAKGLVPASGGGTTTFLRADGSFAAPSGSSPTTTKGDLIVRSSSADSRLAVGTNGQVLTADSAETLGVKWATPSGGGGNLNLCVVSYPLDGDGLNGTTLVQDAFTKVVFNTVNVDQASAWDSTNNEYVVPEDGLYFISTKLRPQDNAGEGRSYGQGSGTTVGDSASFSWFVGANAESNSRNGSLNIRVMDLDLGDRVKMFYYLDGYATTGQVEMIIYKL